MATYAQTLRSLSDAVCAVMPYWLSNTPAPTTLTDELAAIITRAPLEHLAEIDRSIPTVEVHKLLAWAHDYNERRKHAQFFELLKQLNEIDADSPEHAKLFMQAMLCAPERYIEAAMEVTDDFLPTTTHVNEQGQPVYSIQQIAQHVGKPVEQVQSDVERLIADGLIDASARHTGSSHSLQ